MCGLALTPRSTASNQAIRAAGAKVFFLLPPDSPDFDPIEPDFATLIHHRPKPIRTGNVSA